METTVSELAASTEETVQGEAVEALGRDGEMAEHQLDFVLMHQEMDNWCWSSVTTAASNFFGRSPQLSQCTFASDFLVKACCPTDERCDSAQSLSRALSRTGNLRTFVGTDATDAVLIEEIQSGRPVAIRIRWRDGRGHFIAVRGFVRDEDAFQLDVEDPWWGSEQVEVGALRKAYRGSGKWTHTYFTKPVT